MQLKRFEKDGLTFDWIDCGVAPQDDVPGLVAEANRMEIRGHTKWVQMPITVGKAWASIAPEPSVVRASSPNVGDSNGAWAVYFIEGDGGISYDYRYNCAYVRLVRSDQCLDICTQVARACLIKAGVL